MKNFQKRNRARKNESGNVLIYILVAIVLFAALSYVVGNMMRGGNADMIGEEQAKLYAGEILDYARIIRSAVQEMRISNGCTDTDISFENNVVAGYDNGTNTACQVFHADGGDKKYVVPTDKWFDTSLAASTGYGEYLFSGMTTVTNIGIDDGTSNALELIMFIPYIKLSVCNAINEKLNTAHSSGNPPLENADAWHSSFEKFDGTYGGPNTRRIDGQGPIRMAGCREGANASIPPLGTYFFYQVLLVR